EVERPLWDGQEAHVDALCAPAYLLSLVAHVMLAHDDRTGGHGLVSAMPEGEGHENADRALRRVGAACDDLNGPDERAVQLARVEEDVELIVAPSFYDFQHCPRGFAGSARMERREERRL